jgi:hypothetical protein
MVLSPGFSLPDASLSSNFLPVLHPSPAATSPAATVTPWTVAPPLPAVLVSSSPLASLPVHLPWSTEAAAVARRQLLTSFSGHPCPAKNIISSFRDVLLALYVSLQQRRLRLERR